MNELKAMLAMHVVAEQIRSGLKHPSPALIAEAVDTAECVLAEIDRRQRQPELDAAKAAETAKAAQEKLAADAAAEAAAASAVAAKVAAKGTVIVPPVPDPAATPKP